ncbi:hypothetical protein HELRODRAFT_161006 [Helobdella robusta]|uniref:Hormone-sensitive lipase N-terminal domain-containing protein n=1 Tax=Helobdella robusta TaxID=6412 RepID=T1ER00_HELRO|nr:hypothetical protein HELRODRAFT_161006 [Helobdella robusta]ESO01835.1 hypothetical protein HELRODRAFT_161006 [Helobdella robusta]
MNKEEIDKKYIRELDVLLKEIKSFSIVIFEHFKTYSDANSIRFVKSSAFLLEHIDQGLLPYLDGFLIAAGQFDFSSQHPANGYRSVVGLIEKCSLHLLILTRYVALKKKSLLFRNDHYSKEFESYVTLLGQLRACLQYAQKFMSYSSGQLVSEQVSEDEFKIMQEIENLSQEPFYGVCLGFQYNSSMLQTILVMHIILASYSSGYNKSSPFMKLASSVLSSGKFIISPEERAKKVIEATVHGDVNFCKSFWDLSENALLHSIAKVVSPLVAIEKTIHIPLDPPVQVFLSSDPNKHITVSVPNAESSSIMVRLFSYQARQGQNNVVQVQDYALYRNFTTDYFTELRQKTETNRDPFLSPVFASDELLRGLCPVHFISIAKVVSPLVAIEKTIHIPLDPPVQVFLSSDPNKHITVSVPNAESSSIMVRLFSYQARQAPPPPPPPSLIDKCHFLA